eukprot:403331494
MSSVPTKILRNVRSASNLQDYRSNQSPQKPSLEFSDEPYITTKNFAVFTPTLDSIEKLYKSNAFQPPASSSLPQRLLSNHSQRRLIADHHHHNEEEEDQHQQQYDMRQYKPYSQTPSLGGRSASQKILISNQTIQQFADLVDKFPRNQYQIGSRQSNQRLSQEALQQRFGSSQNQQRPQTNQNHTAGVLQGLPLKSPHIKSQKFIDNVEQQHDSVSQGGNQDYQATRNFNHTQSFKKTVSYPGLPWIQMEVDKKYEDPYSKRNFIRTQGAFRASGKESVEQMIQMSQTISSNLKTMLQQQKDPNYLTMNRMIPVPRIVTHPACQKVGLGKRFLIAENDAHQKETNTGYTRKANGTFYNH